MKQIAKTPEIIARLKEAGASVDDVAVFEAIALNNRPLRKRQHVYNGAIAQRSMLLEMALALETESRPLQIMHDGSELPIGRVFRGQVFDGQDTELRVLFWIDKTHEDKIKQVDNGTIDQVSVGILPKQMICSADGFDFFGPDADFETIFTGTTPNGHKVGENGVYCKMVGLEGFFETSLVGQGGAQNARIVNSDQSHFSPHMKALAARASLDRLALTATANTDKPIMDTKELLAELRSTEKESMKVAIENEQLKATNLALTGERDTLKTQLEAASQTAPAVKTELDALKVKHEATEANLTAADTALRDICKKALTAAGQVDAAVPEKLDEVVAKITELKINLTAGGTAKGAESDLKASADTAVGSFRTRR
ncbi:MAG: hypothetical protein EOS05_11645 [Mesorhizobium sp.]|nr:MAG: hypothetical protein EOS05_11645 [Mesorhizobium sp.]